MPAPSLSIRVRLAVVVLAAIAAATPAAAFDTDAVFRKGTRILSVEGGGGVQDNLDGPTLSDLELANAGVRLGFLPYDPWLTGLARGVLEIGLEPFFQLYRQHPDAHFGGLGLAHSRPVELHGLAGAFCPKNSDSVRYTAGIR